jgi:transposase-like protein
MTTMTAARVRTHTGRMDQTPDPEVPERPRPPRQYPAAYKLRILEEYEQLDKAGKGALLRREGLYTSLLSEWRKQRDKGALMRCSSGVAGHRSTRWPGRMPGWSARTRGCAGRSPAKLR